MNKTFQSDRVLTFLRQHQKDMAAMLTRFIEHESPTDNKAAVDDFGQTIAKELKDLDAGIEIFRQPQQGDHLLAQWGTGAGALLLCHMDTVWDVGTLAERPARVEDDRLYGPGSMDMKGGIVVGLWALCALKELNLFPDMPVKMLLNSDEETGSLTSRALIESTAAGQRAVFVLEPARADGAVKTSRKGVGNFRVTTTGRAVHAGGNHEKGINAIDELAYQILQIRELTDYSRGTTVNVGVVQGGTRSNVVPAEASAQVDVRVTGQEEADRIAERMSALAPHFPGTGIHVNGGFNRPPLERNAGVVGLYEKAKVVAAGLGIDLAESSAGGGSDGNFTATMGVPTLDGMGVVGDGPHAIDEYTLISSLPERAALLAGMLFAV